MLDNRKVYLLNSWITISANLRLRIESSECQLKSISLFMSVRHNECWPDGLIGIGGDAGVWWRDVWDRFLRMGSELAVGVRLAVAPGKSGEFTLFTCCYIGMLNEHQRPTQRKTFKLQCGNKPHSEKFPLFSSQLQQHKYILNYVVKQTVNSLRKSRWTWFENKRRRTMSA